MKTLHQYHNDICDNITTSEINIIKSAIKVIYPIELFVKNRVMWPVVKEVHNRIFDDIVILCFR